MLLVDMLFRNSHIQVKWKRSHCGRKSTSYVFLFLVQGEGEFPIKNRFRFQPPPSGTSVSNKDTHTHTQRVLDDQQVRVEGINSNHSFEVQQRVTTSPQPISIASSARQLQPATLMLSIARFMVTINQPFQYGSVTNLKRRICRLSRLLAALFQPKTNAKNPPGAWGSSAG